VLKKHSGKTLHPNHFILLEIIKVLSQLYRVGLDGSEGLDGNGNQVSTEVLQRKRELCKQFLEVLDKIDPGLSRNRGKKGVVFYIQI
jgi:hypothetical protein